MKNSIISLALAAMITGGALPAVAQQPAPSAVAIPRASAWKSPDKVRLQLGAALANRVEGLDTKEMQAFIKNDDNLQLLYMYFFAHLESGRVEANK